MGHNLKSIMKVMRFANRRGKSSFDLYSFVPNVSNKLQYSTNNVRIWNGGEKPTLDTNTMIPVCFLEHINENTHSKRQFGKESCQLFQPVFTDSGMCHSYNPTPVIDLLTESYFMESFHEAFREDLLPNKTLHMGTDSGDAINFYLMGNHRYRHTSRGQFIFGKKLEPSRFLLSLSNNNEYVGMQSSRKIMPAGYKVTFSVQAMEIVPSEDLRDISIESRKCRFYDEIEGLELFKTYSKPACEFEFRLKKAKDFCQCVPWYIPSQSKLRYTICDFYGNYCFNQIMNGYQKSINECLPSCHQIKFTSSEIREKIDSATVCSKSSFEGAERNLAKKIYDNNGYDLFFKIEKLREWIEKGNKLNESMDSEQMEKEFCKELMENDIAEVKVMFERKEYIRTHTSKRVTFPDKLGAFGKIFLLD